MTFIDVYLHEATDYSGKNNHVTENYDKRIVGDDKTVTRYPVDDALVQRMCLDIASAVHRQISEQTMCAIVSDTTASGTTTHRKSEQQKKKQQQKQEHQQQKQEQQQQKQQLQQKKQQQQQRKQQQQQQKQHHKQQQKDQQHEHLHKQQEHRQQEHRQQQQKEQQKPQKRRRHSFPKVSPHPVRYIERKESGIVTTGPEDRYSNDPTVAQVTSVGVVEEDVDDNRQDEDVEQSGKVWEVNMVDDHVMFNSAKSHEQRPEAFTAAAAATTVADDYDDSNQTS
ncbi:myb-like protein I [Myzus persicae]|uniref:myb-like protein I n=1 Tax=Myzus persicae TaxID=13164 RepID=UPI000B937D95|nr:myb-like protein I [Myzus persicae]